jgi:hypothetical protein
LFAFLPKDIILETIKHIQTYNDLLGYSMSDENVKESLSPIFALKYKCHIEPENLWPVLILNAKNVFAIRGCLEYIREMIIGKYYSEITLLSQVYPEMKYGTFLALRTNQLNYEWLRYSSDEFALH